VQVKSVTFIYVAAPPLTASTAAVISNFESVERRLIFHDFLHTLFYKHVLPSRTLDVKWSRRYKGRYIVVASWQHLYLLGRCCGEGRLSQKLTTAQIWDGIVEM